MAGSSQTWVDASGLYCLSQSRHEVEIEEHHAGTGKRFRSAWLGGDLGYAGEKKKSES